MLVEIGFDLFQIYQVSLLIRVIKTEPQAKKLTRIEKSLRKKGAEMESDSANTLSQNDRSAVVLGDRPLDGRVNKVLLRDTSGLFLL